MFNNLGWFADPNIANKPVVPLSSNPVPFASSSNLEPPTSSRTARAPLARRSTLPSSSERPSDTQRQRTGTWSDSPHDEVVASLKGRLSHLRDIDAPDKPDDGAGQADSSAPEGTESKKPVKTRILENMYDPFSGQSIGLLSPGDFDETQDDLWTHLAKIHELQSQISVMHGHMENLGTGERLTRAGRSADDEAENPEDTAKVAKDAEFAKLADQFTGRKEQIDKLMLKLGELSQAINEFHATRAPSIHLTGRNGMPQASEDVPATASTTAAPNSHMQDAQANVTKGSSVETGNAGLGIPTADDPPAEQKPS